MRDSAPATYDALINARHSGIVPRQLLWMRGRNRVSGDPVEAGFWTGDYTLTISVISGATGDVENRVYFGGVNLDIDDIPRVSDLTVESIAVSLSAIPDAVQDMMREHDVRLAKVEVHSLLLDPATRLAVADAEIEFLGEVDDAPIETGNAGGDARVEMSIISDAISMLTRTNPRKRSDQAQRRRQGDRFAQYANAVGTWQIPWGTESQR